MKDGTINIIIKYNLVWCLNVQLSPLSIISNSYPSIWGGSTHTHSCSKPIPRFKYSYLVLLLLLFSSLLYIEKISTVMPHFLFAIALSTLLAVYALRKKSLSKDGAAGAFMLGLATFSSNYWLFTIVLLIFFLSSSRLTKANFPFPHYEINTMKRVH